MESWETLTSKELPVLMNQQEVPVKRQHVTGKTLIKNVYLPSVNTVIQHLLYVFKFFLTNTLRTVFKLQIC